MYKTIKEDRRVQRAFTSKMVFTVSSIASESNCQKLKEFWHVLPRGVADRQSRLLPPSLRFPFLPQCQAQDTNMRSLGNRQAESDEDIQGRYGNL